MTKEEGILKRDLLQEIIPMMEDSLHLLEQMKKELDLSDQNLLQAEETIQKQTKEIIALTDLLKNYQKADESWKSLAQEIEPLQYRLEELTKENTQLRMSLEELMR